MPRPASAKFMSAYPQRPDAGCCIAKGVGLVGISGLARARLLRSREGIMPQGRNPAYDQPVSRERTRAKKRRGTHEVLMAAYTDTGIGSHTSDHALSKVPEVTFGFWIIKILATTLGETGGDAVTMSWLHADKNAHNGGYLIGTGIFLAVFVAAVVAQISTARFNAWIYWLAIVASTTVGTAMADFFDRSLGIGYTGGSSILLACVLCSLAAWYLTLGSINVQTVATPKVEIFYWLTITFSQTLGTALGDWMADSTGLGYDGGALVFCAGLVLLTALYYWTTISRVFLFWAAFILTRPLGATVGDFLDKPTNHGGLALSRPLASAVILTAIVVLIVVLPQRPGRHPGTGMAAHVQ